MAAKQLFRDAKSLIEGYELKAKRGTRRVYLIGRALKSGNVALLRYDSRGSGDARVRQRVSTGVILQVETSLEVKRSNEELLRLQRVACEALNSELERTNADFMPMPKNKVSLTAYVKKVGDLALAESGIRHSVFMTMKSLVNHITEYRGENVLLRDVNREWLLGFISYLKHDAFNVNYMRSKKPENNKKVGISANTQHRIIVNMNFVLNAAVRDGLLTTNPMNEISSKEKVAAKKGTREYLSKDEVDRLRNTPFEHGAYNIKEAFLFSCFTGLRYSDLRAIKRSDFHRDDLGSYLRIKMIKTREPLKIYVPDVALKLMPPTEDDNTPVFKLPKNDYGNQALQKWLKDAGITDKKITFHCGRHSAATLLLSAGIPLAVVSKQLGHLKTATTEIYAKLVDEAQKEASGTMDKLFG